MRDPAAHGNYGRSASGTMAVLAAIAAGSAPGVPSGRWVARPIGPLATYSGDDTWTGQPYTDGVVLVGDAAGYNSPIIGQGLSIAMRDARAVRDAIRSGDPLPGAFRAYGAEREERMRRLRAGAIFMSAIAADDCDNRVARRARFFELQQTEPLTGAMLGSVVRRPGDGATRDVRRAPAGSGARGLSRS